MTNGWKIFTAFCILTPIVGGGLYVGVNVYHLMKWCTTVEKYQLVDIDLKSITFKVTVRFKNPSGWNIVLKSYSLDVKLNGTRVGAIINSTPLTLKAGGYTDIVIPITAYWNKTFTKAQAIQLLEYFSNKQYDKILLNISGGFHGELLKIPVKKSDINVDYSLAEIIKIMDAPETAPC